MSKALIANAEYSLILKKILILMQKQNSAEILAEEYIFKLIITMPIFFISVCLSFKEIGHHSIKPFQCPYGRHYILEGYRHLSFGFLRVYSESPENPLHTGSYKHKLLLGLLLGWWHREAGISNVFTMTNSITTQK